MPARYKERHRLKGSMDVSEEDIKRMYPASSCEGQRSKDDKRDELDGFKARIYNSIQTCRNIDR